MGTSTMSTTRPRAESGPTAGDVKISDLSKIKGNLLENMLKKHVELGEVFSPLPSTMCSLLSREPHRPLAHAGQRER